MSSYSNWLCNHVWESTEDTHRCVKCGQHEPHRWVQAMPRTDPTLQHRDLRRSELPRAQESTYCYCPVCGATHSR